jgi:adenylate cyclase
LRYLFEEYAFDTDRRELHRGTDVAAITPQAFDLLEWRRWPAGRVSAVNVF